MQEKKLNLLFIAHERKLGGASLSLIALVKEIQKQGHNITVIVPTKKCPVAMKFKEIGIPTIAIFMPWWQMPSYWNPLIKLCFRMFYYLEIFEVWYALICFRKIEIDIVHSNSSVIDFGARIAKCRKCKHVWHIREFGDADYKLEYLRGKQRTWNYINNNTDSIVFISKALMQYFQLVANAQKSVVVYNGISSEYLLDRVYSNKKEITFLISGNLNRNKQQLLVLQAASELLRRKKDNFQILIAGTATSMTESKKYQEELKEYIEENLKNYAHMLGRIEDMNSIRKQADVEIISSSREAFGRVTIEGMMAGMPVLVSDSGANVELVQDGIQGFIFQSGNYVSLADRMEKILNDIGLIERLGTEANWYARNMFTADKNARILLQLYLKILEQNIN